MPVNPGGRSARWKAHRERPEPVGLTLIEVLIAASVLAVALLGMAGAFPTALRQVSFGGRITKATSLAHQMMEDIRGDRSYYIPLYNGANTANPASYPANSPGACGTSPSTADVFCGNTKLTRWAQDVTGNTGDGRPLAQASGTVAVVDQENPLPGGGGPVSTTTSILRVTVTVSWNEQTRPQSVALAATVPCLRAGCN